VKPAYSGTSRDGNFFPFQAVPVSYGFLIFGCPGL